MALYNRGKKELFVGPRQGRTQRGTWGRRFKLVIVALIGCALFVLGMRHDFRRAELRVARVEIEQLMDGARNFRRDFNRCPHDVDELAHPPAGGTPYVARRPRDPWGRSYVLQCPSRWGRDEVDIASRGPDGQWLGGDDISSDL